MKNKFIHLLIAALLVFGALFAARPVSAHSDGSQLTGVIFAVNPGANTLTVTPKKGGANVVFNVSSSTVIFRLNHHATLADLQLGDRVEVNYNPSTLLASWIKADLNLVKQSGLVTAINSGGITFTVMSKKSSITVVLNVNSTTLITRKGKPATLADIQLGDLVEAQYNPVTFLVARISAKPYLAEIKGTISAAGTPAGTITVMPKKGATGIVLNVDATTMIKRNNAPATLAQLQLGDRVDVKYNAVTMLAAKIDARANLADLEGAISALGANTVTVTPKKGAPGIVLNVDATTLIRRNNAPATLAQLQVGDRVEAKYNAVSMLAVKIEAHASLVDLEGIISAVGANTVTVMPKKGTTGIVLNVDATTVIKRNDAPSTLTDLQIGDRVTAKYNAVSMLAVRIDARVNLVDLEGKISAVGADSVTVTPEKGGADIILKVDAKTVIKRNNATATLADLKIGDRVEAKYIAVTMLAASINANMGHFE